MVVSLNVSASKKDTGSLIITGEPDALSGMVSRGTVKVKTTSVVLAGKNLRFCSPAVRSVMPEFLD